MDIYKFINSMDIRNHLKEINYEFSPVEAAWLVWQCFDMTLERKHKAWNEIIETLPDVPITNSHHSLPSLHQFLKEYMQLEKKIINRFYNPVEKSVYQYEVFERDENEKHAECVGNDILCNAVFFDFSSCYKKALEEAEDMVNATIRVTRKEAEHDRENQIMQLCFIADWPFIDENNLGIIRHAGRVSVEEKFILYDVFEYMRFDFPNPFKKGDVVRLAKRLYRYGVYNTEPFLFMEIENEPLKQSFLVYKPMRASGYFQDEDNGQLYRENWYGYMDLEYYTEELTGEKRVLKALGNYFKGKIDIVLFANAYHYYLTDSHSQSTKVNDWDWSVEELKLAGLKEE